MDVAGRDELGHHGGNTAGTMIVLTQIFTGRLQVHQKRQAEAHLFPIGNFEFDPDVPCNAIQVIGRIGGAANGSIHGNGVLEGLACHDLRRRQIFKHHFHGAAAGLIGHLSALAVGRRDRRIAGQRHAQGLGQGVHRRGRAHGVAEACRRGGRCHKLNKAFVIQFASCEFFPRHPYDCAGPGALALVPAVEHGA